MPINHLDKSHIMLRNSSACFLEITTFPKMAPVLNTRIYFGIPSWIIGRDVPYISIIIKFLNTALQNVPARAFPSAIGYEPVAYCRHKHQTTGSLSGRFPMNHQILCTLPGLSGS